MLVSVTKVDRSTELREKTLPKDFGIEPPPRGHRAASSTTSATLVSRGVVTIAIRRGSGVCSGRVNHTPLLYRDYAGRLILLTSLVVAGANLITGFFYCNASM